MWRTKAIKPYARRTEDDEFKRPRLEIIESILISTAPKWNGKKFAPSMSLKEACEKEGITDLTFRNWRADSPKIAQYVDDVRESRKEMMHLMMKEVALKNVMEGLSGWVKLRPLDKINISLRYLEKTENEFNPSTKVDIENKTLVLNMGSEEMEQRIMELAAQLKINNLQQYATDNTPAILANPIEESTWDGETPMIEGGSTYELSSSSEWTKES